MNTLITPPCTNGTAADKMAIYNDDQHVFAVHPTGMPIMPNCNNKNEALPDFFSYYLASQYVELAKNIGISYEETSRFNELKQQFEYPANGILPGGNVLLLYRLLRLSNKLDDLCYALCEEELSKEETQYNQLQTEFNEYKVKGKQLYDFMRKVESLNLPEETQLFKYNNSYFIKHLRALYDEEQQGGYAVVTYEPNSSYVTGVDYIEFSREVGCGYSIGSNDIGESIANLCQSGVPVEASEIDDLGNENTYAIKFTDGTLLLCKNMVGECFESRAFNPNESDDDDWYSCFSKDDCEFWSTRLTSIQDITAVVNDFMTDENREMIDELTCLVYGHWTNSAQVTDLESTLGGLEYDSYSNMCDNKYATAIDSLAAYSHYTTVFSSKALNNLCILYLIARNGHLY